MRQLLSLISLAIFTLSFLLMSVGEVQAKAGVIGGVKYTNVSVYSNQDKDLCMNELFDKEDLGYATSSSCKKSNNGKWSFRYAVKVVKEDVAKYKKCVDEGMIYENSSGSCVKKYKSLDPYEKTTIKSGIKSTQLSAPIGLGQDEPISDISDLRDPATGSLLVGYMKVVYGFAAWAIGIISVLAMLIGGIEIAAAGANPDGVSSGKKKIYSAIGGIILFLLMSSIFGLILPGFF